MTIKEIYHYLAPRVAENIEEACITLQRSLRSKVFTFRDDDPDPANTVFLCGTMRSGSTWLGEVLNYAHEYRILYEPFNPRAVPLCRGFWERQYLRPDDENPAFLEPARAILSGDIRNPWIDQYNTCKIVNQRLIKEVRASLMLKWIRNHFPRTPIIFLLRHPCAVASSRCKVGYRTDIREKVFFRQETLMSDYLEQLAPKFAWANSDFERHVVDWCIETYIPLAQLKLGDVFLASYENIVANPKAELQRLFAFLKRPFDDAVMDHLAKPSTSSRRKGDKSPVLSGDNIVEGWRKYVSPDQMNSARKIAEIFGLEQIYGERSYADQQEVEKRLGQRIAPAYA
jgi:hypothetical protein